MEYRHKMRSGDLPTYLFLNGPSNGTILLIGIAPSILSNISSNIHPILKDMKLHWICNQTQPTPFLDASSHLYKRVCPYVRPSVRMSVRPFRFSAKNRPKWLKSISDASICRPGLFFLFPSHAVLFWPRYFTVYIHLSFSEISWNRLYYQTSYLPLLLLSGVPKKSNP